MAWVGILHGLWIFLPAYVANMGPVFVAKLIPGWTAPIDGGRVGKDGNRILGPGKTWRGLAGGTLLGALTALAVAWAAQRWNVMQSWDYGASAGSPWWAIAIYGAAIGYMALVGDAVKSYFKRRLGKQRGAPWVPFDQLDFVVFGLAAMVLAGPVLADGWVRGALLDDWAVLATIVLLTPLLHFAVNIIGYGLKLKDVPW